MCVKIAHLKIKIHLLKMHSNFYGFKINHGQLLSDKIISWLKKKKNLLKHNIKYRLNYNICKIL